MCPKVGNFISTRVTIHSVPQSVDIRVVPLRHHLDPSVLFLYILPAVDLPKLIIYKQNNKHVTK